LKAGSNTDYFTTPKFKENIDFDFQYSPLYHSK
jgi:hypothetical protein